jgi:hypothetical protein
LELSYYIQAITGSKSECVVAMPAILPLKEFDPSNSGTVIVGNHTTAISIRWTACKIADPGREHCFFSDGKYAHNTMTNVDV